MRMVDLITLKRNNQALDEQQMHWMISNYTNRCIPDYQMSAFLMATVFNGMTAKECLYFTEAIVNSGAVINLDEIEGIKVDKHSTGGVGDKTSLVLGPLVASVGVKVAKMSGRGLGHTGGTIDKLEAISGLQVEQPFDAFIKQVNDIGLAIVGQSEALAPADKLLYALRDVTATVDSIPLIASSIMSKKIAAGADAIVLDVKFGEGAFMKTYEEAVSLAKAMVEIGQHAKRETIAYLTDMSQPLGNAIGNALEVKEAIETLQGKGPKDLEELVLQLGSAMVVLAKQAKTKEEAYARLKQNLRNDQAFNVFKDFIKAQGGAVCEVEDCSLLPRAPYVIEVKSQTKGFVKKIDALTVGVAAMKLGAGRLEKGEAIDMGVGIVLNKKVGDAVEVGDILGYLHSNTQSVKEVSEQFAAAYELTFERMDALPLIYNVIESV